jgi:hypothetical protein
MAAWTLLVNCVNSPVYDVIAPCSAEQSSAIERRLCDTRADVGIEQSVLCSMSGMCWDLSMTMLIRSAVVAALLTLALKT